MVKVERMDGDLSASPSGPTPKAKSVDATIDPVEVDAENRVTNAVSWAIDHATAVHGVQFFVSGEVGFVCGDASEAIHIVESVRTGLEERGFRVSDKVVTTCEVQIGEQSTMHVPADITRIMCIVPLAFTSTNTYIMYVVVVDMNTEKLKTHPARLATSMALNMRGN